MADRPILFSGPMVRALLAGTKTQTRRVLKPQPSDYTGNPIPPEGRSWTSKKRDEPYFAMHDDQIHWCWWDEYNRQGPDWIKLRIAKGDRLYVREHWRTSGSLDSSAPRDIPRNAPVIFEADGFPAPEWRGRFRQGMHMPRWASRLTLTVTDVRVQRLQNCTAADALAEGVSSTEHWRPKDVQDRPFEEKWWDDFTFWSEYPQLAYRELWETINGPGSWESNPWIYAVSFTVQRGNIDAQV